MHVHNILNVYIFFFVRCLVQEVKSGVGALGLSSCSDLGNPIAEGVE